MASIQEGFRLAQCNFYIAILKHFLEKRLLTLTERNYCVDSLRVTHALFERENVVKVKSALSGRQHSSLDGPRAPCSASIYCLSFFDDGLTISATSCCSRDPGPDVSHHSLFNSFLSALEPSVIFLIHYFYPQPFRARDSAAPCAYALLEALVALHHARDEIRCACLTIDPLDRKPEIGAVDVTDKSVASLEEVSRNDDLLGGVAGEHGPNIARRSRRAVNTSRLYRLEADE